MHWRGCWATSGGAGTLKGGHVDRGIPIEGEAGGYDLKAPSRMVRVTCLLVKHHHRPAAFYLLLLLGSVLKRVRLQPSDRGKASVASGQRNPPTSGCLHETMTTGGLADDLNVTRHTNS